MRFLVFIAVFAASRKASAASQCKTTPSSPSWPAAKAWDVLNSTLGGQLINPVPPGSVCHPSQPNFDAVACLSVTQQWNSSIFHGNDPSSVDWPNFFNDSCLPEASGFCDRSAYPAKVVNASTSDHVRMAVDFARENNIRLVVKATGHDVLGRKAGIAPSSLSIWTHYLQGIEFYEDYKPAGCEAPLGLAAAKIAAGMQMGAIYASAAAHNVTIVGGDVDTVGIIGLLTGGGYGPLSSTYGTAADAALEFEVVTADGNLLVVNECQHTDLFWALRGGSAETFGVVTSVTVRTFPDVHISSHVLVLNVSSPNSEIFWDVATMFHSDLPRLTAGGFSGQYFIVPDSSHAPGAGFLGNLSASILGGPPQGVISWELSIVNNTIAAAEALAMPLLDRIGNLSSEISFEVQTAYFPDFASYGAAFNGLQEVGVNALIGGRFLDTKSLQQNHTLLKQSLKAAVAPTGGLLLGEPLMAEGVWKATPRGGENALSDAWRSAVTNLLIPVSWTSHNTTERDLVTSDLTNTRVAALRELAPDTGVYLNECDPNEPAFQEAFWGDKYSRLLAVKHQYDPQGVFYCRPCVGSEFYVEGVNGEVCSL